MMIEEWAQPEQKIYEGQTALQVQLDTEINLSTGSSYAIKYVDPDGATGSWSAAVYGDAADGIIGTTSAPALAAGVWKIWAYVTFADGSVAPGDPVTFRVYTEGS